MGYGKLEKHHNTQKDNYNIIMKIKFYHLIEL